MADIETKYSGSATSLTVTGLSTLANGSSATSDVITNTSALSLDYLVYLEVTTASGATATGICEVYAKASLDNTNFDDDNNDRWIGTLTTGTTGIQTKRKVFSIASAFGGAMPPYTKIRVRNVMGAALTAASVSYVGILGQTV